MLEREIADRLTKGAANACMGLTSEWQHAKVAKIQHNGAMFLIYGQNFTLPIAELRKVDGKGRQVNQYRLTPLGLKVRAILIARRNARMLNG